MTWPNNTALDLGEHWVQRMELKFCFVDIQEQFRKCLYRNVFCQPQFMNPKFLWCLFTDHLCQPSHVKVFAGVIGHIQTLNMSTVTHSNIKCLNV